MANYTSFPTNIAVKLRFLYGKPLDPKQDRWGNLKYPYGVMNINEKREEYLYATEKLHEVLQKLGISKGSEVEITKKEDGQYKYFEVVFNGEVLTTQGTPKIEGTSGTKEVVPDMPPQPPAPWEDADFQIKKTESGNGDKDVLNEIERTVNYLSVIYSVINTDEVLQGLEEENKKAMAISVYINIDRKGLI